MSLTGSFVPSASTPAVTVSKDTIRARAVRFAADWADATISGFLRAGIGELRGGSDLQAAVGGRLDQREVSS